MRLYLIHFEGRFFRSVCRSLCHVQMSILPTFYGFCMLIITDPFIGVARVGNQYESIGFCMIVLFGEVLEYNTHT